MATVRLLLAALVATAVLALGRTPQVQADGCRFVLGFAQLAQMIPQTVGQCLDDEQHNADNGDGLQHTTGGLLVWRKSDNITAFTDGATTWLLAPSGLAQRPNAQRFSWEANPDGLPIADAPGQAAAAGAMLPGRRIVAYYGNPLVPAMGTLGQGSPEQMLARLQEQAAAYAAADPKTPVQPALELVTVVAQGGPGPDGLFRSRMSADLIEQVAQWAASKQYLLILDVQPGRSSVASEVQFLLPYLKRPNVHLALDPEFAMADGQVPGQVYGSLDAAAINGAIQTLADLVQQENIPPRVLIVHRFREDMLTNYRQIRPDPQVQVVVDMDGFGSPDNKLASYQDYVHDQPVQYAGVKLFYQQDAPLWTPRQVLGLDPTPAVVIYQ